MVKAVISYDNSGFNLLVGGVPQCRNGQTLEALLTRLTPDVAKGLRKKDRKLAPNQALAQARDQITKLAKKAKEAFAHEDEIDFKEEKS